jgi:RNA polymerase sigma-70 factor (ECF subfamily)
MGCWPAGGSCGSAGGPRALTRKSPAFGSLSTTPHFSRNPVHVILDMIASIPFFGSGSPAQNSEDRATRVSASAKEALQGAELVRRFNGGDESAFVEIITRYRKRMFAVALSQLRNRADAEEIVQDTFIRAHRALARFRGDSALGTWLYRIALNLSHNRYRYLSCRCQHKTRSIDSAYSEENRATVASLVASDAPNPAREMEVGEFTRLVADCMAQLSQGRREALAQRNFQHSSYDEIAKTLGINIGTVKSRIARARENLRVQLAKEYPEFGPDASPGEWFGAIRSSGFLTVACS